MRRKKKTNGKTSPIAPNPWRVDHYRLTVFPGFGGNSDLAQILWRVAAERAPKEVVLDPEKNTVKVQGVVGESILHVFSDQNRLDVRQMFHPSTIPNPAAAGIPLQGLLPNVQSPSYSGLIAPFREMAVSLLASTELPPVRRLAFGSLAFKPVPHIEDSRAVLAEHLPMLDMTKTSLTDFLFRFNLPCSCRSIDHLDLNRLSTWAVNIVQDINVMLGARGIPIQTRPSVSTRAQVELDVNSSGTRQTNLPQRQLVELFDEFLTFVRDVIKEDTHR